MSPPMYKCILLTLDRCYYFIGLFIYKRKLHQGSKENMLHIFIMDLSPNLFVINRGNLFYMKYASKVCNFEHRFL